MIKILETGIAKMDEEMETIRNGIKDKKDAKVKLRSETFANMHFKNSLIQKSTSKLNMRHAKSFSVTCVRKVLY